MRTTLTLDDDVVAQLEALRRTRDASFKDIVNDALRAGLQALAEPPRRHRTFHTEAVDLGRCRLPNLDNIGEVLDLAEDEAPR